DVGVVVNAGVAHVGVVGSIEAIAQGKSEIWGHSKQAVYPHGDPRLAARGSQLPHVTFGDDEGAGVRVVAVPPRGVAGPGAGAVAPRGVAGSDVTLDVRGRKLELRVPLVGRHNATNAACAIAVAVALDLDLEVAAANLAQARPAKQRGEIVDIGGRHVLVDCYN